MRSQSDIKTGIKASQRPRFALDSSPKKEAVTGLSQKKSTLMRKRSMAYALSSFKVKKETRKK
jgi:hypothetical protein